MSDKLTPIDRQTMVISMNDTYASCARPLIQRLASLERQHQASLEHLSLCDTSEEFYSWLKKQRSISTRH